MGVEKAKRIRSALSGGSKPLGQKQPKKFKKMKNQSAQWFEQNQQRLNETSNKEKAAALKELREYVRTNLRGRTLYGAHSDEVLGINAEDYYLEKAWAKLYYGVWEWKEGRTLAGQLKKIASCLMQKQVNKFRNQTDGNAKQDDVWNHMANMDVERMSGVPKCVMTEDGRMLTEDEAQKEEGYELMLEVLKDKPEQVEYVLEVKKGGTYDDIAEAMGIEVEEVRLIERRVLRRLTAYRLKTKGE